MKNDAISIHRLDSVKEGCDGGKDQMIADLIAYDVKISTVEKEAAIIKDDPNIDEETKSSILSGLREYWKIKKDKMRTETKGSKR